jgi:hypothetical protein
MAALAVRESAGASLQQLLSKILVEEAAGQGTNGQPAWYYCLVLLLAMAVSGG